MQSDHTEKVESININANSRYFTTASKDCVTVWQLRPQVKKICTIPLDHEDQESNANAKQQFSTKVLAAIDDSCKLLCIYKGKNFLFTTYLINQNTGIYNMKDNIDL